MTRIASTDSLLHLLQTEGHALYGGEQVTQLEHALQAAALAEAEAAPDHLVVAALLHDVGHLLEPPESLSGQKPQDGHHEHLAARELAPLFGPEITQPILLHVAAKRYLCAVDPMYQATLSPESLRTLALQGGPMAAPEIAAFESLPHAQDAVRLRRWDDLAKEPGRPVPELLHYRDRVARASDAWVKA